MLVDSHCHLDFPDFEKDLPSVLDRAREGGVGHFLTICTHITKFQQVLDIASVHSDIHCTVGIHPHEAESQPEIDAKYLINIATKEQKVVAYGETGLDFFYNNSPRKIQEKQFREHIKAARETGLPVVIHTRDADIETANILKEEMSYGKFSGVIHCFSSGLELASLAIELGLHISLSGILTFKNAKILRELVTDLPIERLLVETDSPYLAPVPHRGKRNEPLFVNSTLDCLAEVMKLDRKIVEDITTNNFFHLFSKIQKL
ncbi:MAG: LuxR family transcriptional regulator [Rhodospirillaceae bacterium]|nr:LuxR family transcriptional regulator [Rhodospirillaceae bacterium]